MTSTESTKSADATGGQECRHFLSGYCRSCTQLAVPYAEQLVRKEERVRSVVSRISSSARVIPIVQSNPSLASRAKAKMLVGGSIEHPIVGLPDDSKKGKELLDCPLHLPLINKIVSLIPKLITRHRIPPYSILKKAGELNYIIVKCTLDGRALVRWVLRSRDCEDLARRANLDLIEAHAAVKMASINIQPEHTSTIEGDEEIPLTELQFLEEALGGRVLVHTAQSFSQVTPRVARALYEYVAKVVEEKRPALALDLFCGSGAFALFSAPHADRIVGVESSSGAVEAAKIAAKKNRFENVTFIANDVDHAVELLTEKPNLVIVNPPRRGLSPQLCEAIVRMHPATLIYSSCNPETFARDAALLGKAYTLVEAAPFDMFPHSDHMEVVGTFSR